MEPTEVSIIRWSKKTKNCTDLSPIFVGITKKNSSRANRTNLRFFQQNFRSIFLIFQYEVTVRNLRAYRTLLPGEVFDISLPENSGFCQPQTDQFYPGRTDFNVFYSFLRFFIPKFFLNLQVDPKCLPAGLLNLTQCKFGDGSM